MKRAGRQRAILDKKRTVILLRSVVVISTSYLILFGPDATQPLSIAYILTLMLTNVALLAVPAEAFHRERVSAALLLADTVFVLTGRRWSKNCWHSYSSAWVTRVWRWRTSTCGPCLPSWSGRSGSTWLVVP